MGKKFSKKEVQEIVNANPQLQGLPKAQQEKIIEDARKQQERDLGSAAE